MIEDSRPPSSVRPATAQELAPRVYEVFASTYPNPNAKPILGWPSLSKDYQRWWVFKIEATLQLISKEQLRGTNEGHVARLTGLLWDRWEDEGNLEGPCWVAVARSLLGLTSSLPLT